MRLGAIILAIGICLGGCAARHVAVAPAVVEYEASTASALAFDPPIIAGEAPVELGREERAMSAFVSFEGPVTTYFWILTDDSQRSDWGRNCIGGVGDCYERRAITEKTGFTYR